MHNRHTTPVNKHAVRIRSAAVLLALCALALFAAPIRSLPQNRATDDALLYLPLVIKSDPPAQVIRIVDGDTIEVQADDQRARLRYIGMDTPERGAPFFSQATEANRRLVQGQLLVLERDVSNLDRYARLLRYVYRQDGLFVNAELVRQGWARAANYPPDERYRTRFAELEQEARAAKRGIWADVTPTATPSAPTPTPNAPTPTPTTTPPVPGDVVISYVRYDGEVSLKESDEYAEIINLGAAAVNLDGWRLNAGNVEQDYLFGGFVLAPGQRCRVYTNEVHSQYCGLSFGIDGAIWYNQGDCGHLYDASGTEVSRYCYYGEDDGG